MAQVRSGVGEMLGVLFDRYQVSIVQLLLEVKR